MVEILKKIGLTEKEVTVYLAALKLGKSSVDDIAKEAKNTRTNTYNQIDTLQKKGLITTIAEGKRNYYLAEDPENLTRVLEQQKTQLQLAKGELDVILPELSTLYTRKTHKPIVRFFAGKEGLVTVRNEILKMDGKELLVASSFDKFTKLFTKEERNNYSKKRRAKKIQTKLLFSSKTEIPVDKNAPENFKRVKEEDFPFEFDVYIYDNKVVLASYEDGIWSILIESKAVARSMEALYNIAWSVSS